MTEGKLDPFVLHILGGLLHLQSQPAPQPQAGSSPDLKSKLIEQIKKSQNATGAGGADADRTGTNGKL